MAMKVTVTDKQITVVIDREAPHPSASGKTMVIASSQGNQPTTATIDGKPLIVGFNAYIKA